MPNAARAALVLAALLAALPAAAALYKWVDADGKTQYGDQPPKNFKGEVIRLDIEFDKTTMPSQPQQQAQPPRPAPPAGKAEPDGPAIDIATKRRNTRERLETQLKSAREKAESARQALAEAESPTPEERQIIQQRVAGGGMHGMAPRSNCRVEGSGSRKTLMCPTFVPTGEYHERVARLEEDVRKAEEALAAAEEAWRRGVD